MSSSGKTTGGPTAFHPERELDYYEVDLRDYLRVLWQGKWIVLAVFLVAVGVAAIVSFRSPDVYRATVKLMVLRPSGLPFSYSPPPAAAIAAWVGDPGVLRKVGTKTGFSSGWLGKHLKTTVKGTFIDLSVEGPVVPNRLQGVLDVLLSALEERGKEHLVAAAQGALASLAAKREELSHKLSLLDEELSRAKKAAQGQREELLREIGLKIASVRADLSLGQSTTPRGYNFQKELDTLYARLQAVELFLDSLERLGPAALPGVGGSYIAAKVELSALAAEETNLQGIISRPPSPLDVAQGVRAFRVGPNRPMNVAVAGVLGLFVGILLAFFVYYLKGETEGD